MRIERLVSRRELALQREIASQVIPQHGCQELPMNTPSENGDADKGDRYDRGYTAQCRSPVFAAREIYK